jgi:DNA segregation ATPase FtsK/SpoIIIE, S-DNA-T family
MKKNRKTSSLSDERLYKILGLILLAFSVLLFISFVSYLFTWKLDQDKVMQSSGSFVLQSDIEISNWMGKLGAILSHSVFYWGFGLPSFGLAYILFIFGMDLLRNITIQNHVNLALKIIIGVVITSIILEFIMVGADFPWGGVIGDSINAWIVNFLHIPGTILLYLLVFGSSIIWYTNPEFSGQSGKGIITNFFDSLLQIFNTKKSKTANTNITTNNVNPNINNDEIITSLAPLKESDPITAGLQAIDVQKDQEWETISGLGESETEKKIRPDLEFEIENNINVPTKEVLAPIIDTHGQVELFDHQGLDTPYDPKKELSHYEYPILSLLDIEEYDQQLSDDDKDAINQNKDKIIATLKDYKIEIAKIKATVGPTVTLFQVTPARGVRVSRIKNLEDDIALSLSALKIRIIAPLPGTDTVGIEVPNKNRRKVFLREALMSDSYRKQDFELPVALGKTIDNRLFVTDLTKMPHLLIAGATGQGKSVGINTILLSLLYKKHPSELKLVLIDPKKVELSPYNHLTDFFLGFLEDEPEPIITETSRVVRTLNSLCCEMDKRYDLLKLASVRNIKEYNEKFKSRQLNPNNGHRFLPFIVLVIDEFADLIMTAGKEVELPIGRLSQLSRAVGIHLIIATQRPSVNIITGVIKANFPARLAYKVSSKIDSRTILDAGGADQLIGHGDMLLSYGSEVIRLQSPFVDTHEVEKVMNFISAQRGFFTPFFLPEPEDGDSDSIMVEYNKSELDPLLKDACKMILETRVASTSMIQRRMKLGFNRAGRIMDQLQSIGVVGPPDGKKQRGILITNLEELERLLDNFGR